MIVLAGSRELRPKLVAKSVLRLLLRMPPDSTVLLRRGITTRPGPFERAAARICELIDIKVDWCIPEPDELHPGRAAVFVRDYKMTGRADVVIGFFPTHDLTEGTWHVIEKAIDHDIPAYAFLASPQGIERIGEWDPHKAWGL